MKNWLLSTRWGGQQRAAAAQEDAAAGNHLCTCFAMSNERVTYRGPTHRMQRCGYGGGAACTLSLAFACAGAKHEIKVQSCSFETCFLSS